MATEENNSFSSALWMARFEETRVWIHKNGALRTPKRSGSTLQLNYWWTTQRRKYREGSLLADRVKALRNIGFLLEDSPPNNVVDIFMHHVSGAQNFLHRHGHLDIPQRTDKPRGLGRWSDNLRQLAKDDPNNWRVVIVKELLPEFVWVSPHPRNNSYTRDELWQHSFRRLRLAKKVLGHANVPRDWNELKESDGEPHLGIWLYKQRCAYRNGTLDAVKFRSLLEIGVDFSPSSGPRSVPQMGPK